MSLDAVIFDIGNVLLRFDYLIAANKLLAVTGAKEYPSREKVTELVLAYESGALPRQEFVARTRAEFGHQGGDEEFLRIWEDIFEPNTLMLGLLPEFARQQRIFLLSNMGCIHREFIFRRYDFFSRFEAGVFSYQAKHAKPSREIFRIAEQSFGVSPAKTLYIDDVKENVDAAEACGFIAVHYDPEAHEKFEGELSQRKIHPVRGESLTPPPANR